MNESCIIMIIYVLPFSKQINRKQSRDTTRWEEYE